MSEIIFSEDYAGPRFTYGLRNRPLGYGAQPVGHILGSEGTHARFPLFGTIQYPRELTEKECRDYELTFLGPISEERALRRAAAVVFACARRGESEVSATEYDSVAEYTPMSLAERIYAADHLDQVATTVEELFGIALRVR